MLLNPDTETFRHLDDRSGDLMKKTIGFFETKGKKKLKHDAHERVWYEDFLTFVKENKVFSTLLTPADQAGDDPDKRWDTFRICDMNEILGFYGLSYWYAWQVSILGLGPIWMSGNDAVKRKTAALLDAGGIFAFGLSERAHGADLYSSEMAVTPLGNGRYAADGGKYYIGNGNRAALVSVFGKNSETDDYVFFAADSAHPKYECVQNVVDWQGYVAELALHSYPLTDADILSRGREAWDAALNTVNIGKFNLGWASIGICTHAFYEAIRHASRRNLYERFVTDFPHIQRLFMDAYTRLSAMRLFSSRAADYLRAASETDRRYLLYNPIVKMKVTTQGEEVINLLWDIIAAKGFEKDGYFETAAKDIRSLPKLEGTVHVNMALIVKFMANYFFAPEAFPEVGRQSAPVHDDFLFRQGPTRGLGKIRFHDYRPVYSRLDLPNIAIFREQTAVLEKMLLAAGPDGHQARNMDFLLSLGELFTLTAYGQLIIEKALMDAIEPDFVDQVFDFMVRDFSSYALQLYSKTATSEAQMRFCLEMIRKPSTDPGRFTRLWEKYVLSQKDVYAMNP